jgi:hypothetical protein
MESIYIYEDGKHYQCPLPEALELDLDGFLANVEKKLTAGQKVVSC